jgi:HSP20 family molecular chaperone IbpA
MRWEPFEDLLALQRGLGRRRRRASLWPSEFAPLSREMTLDAYETKDEIVFTAVVPGVKNAAMASSAEP